MKDLPAHRRICPFGQGQEIQVFLRRLENDLDFRPAIIVGQKLLRRRVNVGHENEVPAFYGIPVLVLYLEPFEFVFVFDEIVL